MVSSSGNVEVLIPVSLFITVDSKGRIVKFIEKYIKRKVSK